MGVAEITEVVGDEGTPQGGGQEAAGGSGGADTGVRSQPQLQAILPPPPAQPPNSAARLYDINYAPIVSTVKEIGEALKNRKINLASAEYRLNSLTTVYPKFTQL